MTTMTKLINLESVKFQHTYFDTTQNQPKTLFY